MTFWTDTGFSWNVHKFPLWGSFLQHCFITRSSAVINVSGVKHAWGYTHFLYIAVSFERWHTQYFVHAHHFYIWAHNWLKSSGRLLIGDECLFHQEPAIWMTHYFGIPTTLFWSAASPILHFDFPFPLFIFHLSPNLFLFSISFFFPFPSVCLPCFKSSSFKLSSVQTVFCRNQKIHSVCSHMLIGKN